MLKKSLWSSVNLSEEYRHFLSVGSVLFGGQCVHFGICWILRDAIAAQTFDKSSPTGEFATVQGIEGGFVM